MRTMERSFILTIRKRIISAMLAVCMLLTLGSAAAATEAQALQKMCIRDRHYSCAL